MKTIVHAALTITFLLLASSGFAASEQRYWQLIMSYDQSELRIVEAAQVPITKKTITTPGLGGAAARIPYDITWLDASGNTIINTTTELPVGYHSAPDENGGPCQLIIPPTGMIVLRMVGPQFPTQPSAVRFTRSSSSRSKLFSQPLPPAVDFDSRVIQIDRLVQRAARRDGPFQCTKLRNTGPDANRLVFVVFGDGYTQANLDAGLFVTAANNFVAAFNGRSPWDILFNGTNVYRVDVVSNESGSDNDPYGTYRDTYFNSTFWSGGIERALVVDNTGYYRAVNAANIYIGDGLWDDLFVLVNSTKYGGTGGSIATISVHPSAGEIALHETGHTFADLADEYTTAYPGFPPGDGEANVDYDYSGPGLKWLTWVTPGAPLPTPNNSAYSGVIGAFEGARYLTTGIYRPSYNCLMRALGVELDVVCKEAHVHQFTSVVNLVDTTTPPANSTGLTGTTFSVQTIPIGTMTFQWKVGDSILAGETGSSVNLTSGAIYGIGRRWSAPLQVTVTYPTTLMRQFTAQQVVSWTLGSDCNGNGILDSIDIRSGHSLDDNNNRIPDECDGFYCCAGTRGDVNTVGIVDLADLSALVSYLTGGGYKLPCEREANVNGLGIVDLADLSSLVSFLTGGGYVLPNCP